MRGQLDDDSRRLFFSDDPVEVVQLVSSGTDVDVKDYLNYTPLMYASLHGKTNVVEALLGCGAEVHSMEIISGRTALSLAVMNGCADTVGVLCRHIVEECSYSCGLNCIDLFNFSKETPLMEAARQSRSDIVDILIGSEADPEIRDERRKTACSYATNRKIKTRIQQKIAEKQRHFRPMLDANKMFRGIHNWHKQEFNTAGFNILMQASLYGSLFHVKLALQCEDVNKTTFAGLTALMLATSQGHQHIVEALCQESTAYIDAIDTGGHTALMYAVIYNHNNCAKTLLEYGADPHILWYNNSDGQLPTKKAFNSAYDIAIAVKEENVAIRDLLCSTLDRSVLGLLHQSRAWSCWLFYIVFHMIFIYPNPWSIIGGVAVFYLCHMADKETEKKLMAMIGTIFLCTVCFFFESLSSLLVGAVLMAFPISIFGEFGYHWPLVFYIVYGSYYPENGSMVDWLNGHDEATWHWKWLFEWSLLLATIAATLDVCWMRLRSANEDKAAKRCYDLRLKEVEEVQAKAKKAHKAYQHRAKQEQKREQESKRRGKGSDKKKGKRNKSKDKEYDREANGMTRNPEFVLDASGDGINKENVMLDQVNRKSNRKPLGEHQSNGNRNCVLNERNGENMAKTHPAKGKKKVRRQNDLRMEIEPDVMENTELDSVVVGTKAARTKPYESIDDIDDHDVELAMGMSFTGGNEVQQNYEEQGACSMPVDDLFDSSETSDDDEDSSSEDELQKFKEQTLQLLEEKTCKICMDAEIGVVFVPCGHLVSCKPCAELLQDCPVCRKVIDMQLPIYKS